MSVHLRYFFCLFMKVESFEVISILDFSIQTENILWDPEILKTHTFPYMPDLHTNITIAYTLLLKSSVRFFIFFNGVSYAHH